MQKLNPEILSELKVKNDNLKRFKTKIVLLFTLIIAFFATVFIVSYTKNIQIVYLISGTLAMFFLVFFVFFNIIMTGVENNLEAQLSPFLEQTRSKIRRNNNEKRYYSKHSHSDVTINSVINDKNDFEHIKESHE